MPKDLVLQSVQASTSLGFIIDGVNLSNTEALGSVLYTDYLPLVEITAMLLLVAIVASITLVHRQTREIKRQKIKKQIMVKKSDRLTIVNLSNEI